MDLGDHSLCPRADAGFSLVELVAVMAVVVTLTVLVVPRLVSGSVGPFADRVRAALHHAQKLAIAQRRNVCVNVRGGTLTLTRAAINGDSVACSLDVPDVSGNSNYALSAPDGVTLGGTTGVVFGALGQPLSAGAVLTSDSTLTVRGDASVTVVIEKITGLIR